MDLQIRFFIYIGFAELRRKTVKSLKVFLSNLGNILAFLVYYTKQFALLLILTGKNIANQVTNYPNSYPPNVYLGYLVTRNNYYINWKIPRLYECSWIKSSMTHNFYHIVLQWWYESNYTKPNIVLAQVVSKKKLSANEASLCGLNCSQGQLRVVTGSLLPVE